MKQQEEMDLTSYLQTEGRRRAAELAAQAGARPQASALADPPRLVQPQADAGESRPQSLTEVLQGMGVPTATRLQRL